MERLGALNMKQTELAEATNTDPCIVSKWIRGFCKPGKQRRPLLEQALQLPEDALLEFCSTRRSKKHEVEAKHNKEDISCR